MAAKTYTVTVASGAQFPSGSTGTVYYLDGVRPTYDIYWVSGPTLKFNLDDPSNDGHPMVFKQTTGASSLLTTGVTYNLDGGNVTEAAWLSGFTAATTRYVEYAPPNELDFIWMCYVHGTTMGGNGLIGQDVWSALTWGSGEYGQQNSVTIPVTNPNDSAFGIDVWGNFFWGGGGSMDATLADVTITAEVNSGWGREDGWGKQLWGEPNQAVAPTGQTMTSTTGSLTITAEVNAGWGAKTWGYSTWGAIGDAVATGQAMTANLANVTITAEVNSGWGALTWSQGSWGVISDVTYTASGQAMTAVLGSAESIIRKGWGATNWGNGEWGELFDSGAILTGIEMTATLGDETVAGEINTGWGRQTWGNLVWGGYGNVIPAGQSMTFGTGTATITTEINIGWGRSTWGAQGWGLNTSIVDVVVSGQLMTATLGDETVAGEINTGWGRYGWGEGNWGTPDNTVILASLPATMALGNVDPAPDVSLTGIEMTMNDGTIGPIIADGTVIPTGFGLTIAMGTGNTLIWNQVDTGTAPTWKEVDTAA